MPEFLAKQINNIGVFMKEKVSSNKSLPELVLTARNISNLTQTQFGKLFEPSVTQPTVARWEKGDLLPDRKHLPKIASCNNLTYEEFLDVVGEIKITSDSKEEEAKNYNRYHLKIINKGAKVWNRWRERKSLIFPLLEGAKPKEVYLDEIDLSYSLSEKINLASKFLRRANLQGADLTEADLSYADLSHADLRNANFNGANLTKTNLTGANLWGADLRQAKLENTYLYEANLMKADLSHANLSHADLRNANFNGANLSYAVLKYCSVYGISIWDVKIEGTVQQKLFVCPHNTETVFVNCLDNALLKSWELKKYFEYDNDILKQIQNLQSSLEKMK